MDQSCDKRLNLLISHIHHIFEYKQYCHVGNTAKQCRLGLFQDSDFAEDLEDSKSTSGWTLCIFGSHTFVLKSWMCKKQTAVSHSSTESEIISFGCRIEVGWYAHCWFMGSDCFSSWKCFSCFRSIVGNTYWSHKEQGDLFKNKREVCSPRHTIHKRKQSQRVISDLDNVDVVPQTHQEVFLYVFEDNEAVIKMVIKGRSPTMRHVSRTHKLPFYWLFDQINLDPEIQMKYIDTQQATRRHMRMWKFHTRWVESFVVACSISAISVLQCALNTMAKRSQHESGEERVTAKSRPTMNIIARAPHVSSSTSVTPEKKKFWKSISLEYTCWERGAIRVTWYRHRRNGSFRLLLPWAIHGKLLFSKLLKVGWWPCLRPIFRATTPLSRGHFNSKGRGKLSIHHAADQETIETFSHKPGQSLRSSRRDVKSMNPFTRERGRPVVMGQSSSSLVLSAIKTEVLLDGGDPAYQNFLLQQYGERIEKFSQPDRLSKFCMGAGFLSFVENGEYFMTKYTGDLSQFNTLACREYTFPREEGASRPWGWIQGNTKIGPVLEVEEDHTYRFTPEEKEKIPRTMVSYSEQSRQKMSPWNFDLIFELLSLASHAN